MKVSIIGSGSVGSQLSQRLIEKEFINKIVLLDIDLGVAKGNALDVNHSLKLSNSCGEVIGTKSYEEVRNSDIVILSAGAPRKEKDSRTDLLKKNKKIIEEIIDKAYPITPNSVFITITNPVDVMNYLVYKKTKLSRKKVLGMAGALDSARFSYYLSQNSSISVSEINSLVIGSHTSKMVPLPNKTSVNGIPCKEFFKERDIKEAVRKTKKAGGKVIKLRNESAYFAPSLGLEKMINSILMDKKEIFSVSVVLKNEYGYEDVSLGVPVILGKNGIKDIIELDLSKEKEKELEESARLIKDKIKELRDLTT